MNNQNNIDSELNLADRMALIAVILSIINTYLNTKQFKEEAILNRLENLEEKYLKNINERLNFLESFIMQKGGKNEQSKQ